MQSQVAFPPKWGVAGAAGVAFLAWLSALWLRASPDESGYLIVASQWRDAGSLYGHYWVDRPPMLVMLYAIADAGGGLVALRLLGAVAVVVSVLLAGLIGRLVAPAERAAPVVAAVTATVFMASPLFGRGAVNGEVLAVPFVLGGIAALLAARQQTHRDGGALLWGVAGAAATAAVLIKQNFLDVFLVAVVMLALPAARGRRGRRAAAFVLGAGVALALVLSFAQSRGTGPVELWDAVVSFRVEANWVVGSSANSATLVRAATLALVLVVSGAVPLLVLGWLQVERSATPEWLDVRIAAGVLVAWEGLAIALGGSYWLHYLMGLVPGLVLVGALASVRPRDGTAAWRRARSWLLIYAAALSIGALAWVAVFPNATDEEVSDYLAEHRQEGDTAVVAFGKPDILYRAEMTSPYPLLWSLPVRVLDPQLHQLDRLLASPARPTWLVTGRSGLDGWGLNPSRSVLDRLARHYRPVAEVDGLVVYLTRERDPVGESRTR